jgi:molybdopterin/thiamine biosynthesis adenylyltransferase
LIVHPWWAGFGIEVVDIKELTPVLAKEFALLAASDILQGVTLAGLRQSSEWGYAGVSLDVEVERPQDLAYPIRGIETVGVLFPFDGGQPSVLALRDDFPDTPHQNWSPPGGPYTLCIDDRPWVEARLSTTASDIARRIQLWLSKAARGELHDVAQPPDPLFFASQISLVLPATALAESKESVELTGIFRSDNANLILTRPAQVSDNTLPTLTIIAFQAQPQGMTRMRHAPNTLATLAIELEKCGVHLYDELKPRLKAWTGLRQLSSRLAIVVAFPVPTGESQGVNDVRAFLTFDSAGDIGVALGVLYASNSQISDGSQGGNQRTYVRAIPEGQAINRDLRVEPAQVHFGISRELATSVAGHQTPDRRRVLLVGAGSLGSQLSLNLVREGMFTWTVVDEDHLLPHNLVRHALFADDVGAPKAGALADQLSKLLGEPVAAIQCDVIRPNEQKREQLAVALAEADIVIDASASVAVSRHLSDLPNVKARRICAFFNPAGISVVVLAESADRNITLRDLEAQYHRIVLSSPMLSGHLATNGPGVRYSGSCRSLTNRIPASNAAILSALAAQGTTKALATDDATISVWTMDSSGEVHLVQDIGAPVTRVQIGTWTIFYDSVLLNDLATLRNSRLPNETGGILLGIADMRQRSVYVAYALSEPEDSHGTEASFERGVFGLAEEVDRAVTATMNQLRYVGEWHSHPDRASAMPSRVDLSQLMWLGSELENEGLPGLMAIAAQDGRFTFVLAGMTLRQNGDH